MLLSSLLAATVAVDGATLSLDADLYDVGQPIGLVVSGQPGDQVTLLLSGSTASVGLPGIGTLGVSLTDGFFAVGLGNIPADGTLEAECEIGCESPLLREPCYLQAVTISTSGAPDPFCITEVITLQGASDQCGLCASDPDNDDSLALDPRDWGLDFSGLGVAERLRFVGGGEFSELPDGTARLRGLLQDDVDPNCRAYVDLLLLDRVSPLDPEHPPVGSPVLGLVPGAYVDQGGALNPANWHYYTLAAGSLEGLQGCLEGARLSLTSSGVAAQVGNGANNANGGFGLEAELVWIVDEQPSSGSLAESGVASLRSDARTCDEGGDSSCPTTADADSDFCTGGDHAVWFKQLGSDWRFVGGFGELIEFDDGTATLTGEIFNTDEPGERFQIDVLLADRVAPGDASHPPAGSPKLGLCDELYADQGGPVDPDTFVYYTETVGLLTGLGDFDGALLAIERKGPSFQIGVGANVKNPNYGLSGWFDITVLQQPFNGFHIEDKNGDFNVDLVDCPDPIAPSTAPICAYDFEAQSGMTAFDVAGDLDLDFQNGNGQIDWVNDAHGRGVRFDQGSSGTARLWAGGDEEADGLLANLVATGAFTVQVAAKVSEDSRDDARIVSFSDGTAVDDRNFSLMVYPHDDEELESEFRVVTSSGAHREELEIDDEDAEADDFAVWAMSFELGVLRGYLDGELIGEWTVGGDLSAFESRSFQLGNEASLNRAFDGVLYDVRIWNRALSEQELSSESGALHQDA